MASVRCPNCGRSQQVMEDEVQFDTCCYCGYVAPEEVETTTSVVTLLITHAVSLGDPVEWDWHGILDLNTDVGETVEVSVPVV